jgi:NADP-dependent 3-hydroxy acid dehydrogenase YdfG
LRAKKTGSALSSENKKAAVVTGASGGIGGAVAEAIAAEGYEVHALGRDSERLARLRDRILGQGGKVITYCADLEAEEHVEEVAGRIHEHRAAIQAVIHVAGWIETVRPEQMSSNVLDRMLAINMRAPFLLTKLLLNSLADAKGQVILINSSASLSPRSENAVYAASKAASKVLFEGWRQDLNRRHIRVTNIFPGRTATEMQRELMEQEGKDFAPEKLIQPADIAQLVICVLRSERTVEITDIQMRPAHKSD